MDLGIGKRIKDKRIELGLSQKELAHRMGYKSEAAISKVEHGEDNITTDRISKFAKALNCSPGYLMGWEEPDSVEDPRLFEVEWRKRGGAAHQLILTEEEEKIVLTYRTADDVDRRAVRRILGMETKKDTDVLDA